MPRIPNDLPRPLTFAAVRNRVWDLSSDHERQVRQRAYTGSRGTDASDVAAARARGAAWTCWTERLEAAWPTLTRPARIAAWRLAGRGRGLAVGRDPGDDVSPGPARALVKAELAFTWAAGEFDLYGPFVYLSPQLDTPSTPTTPDTRRTP